MENKLKPGLWPGFTFIEMILKLQNSEHDSTFQTSKRATAC